MNRPESLSAKCLMGDRLYQDEDRCIIYIPVLHKSSLHECDFALIDIGSVCGLNVIVRPGYELFISSAQSFQISDEKWRQLSGHTCLDRCHGCLHDSLIGPRYPVSLSILMKRKDESYCTR